jgi:hypothetical protein
MLYGTWKLATSTIKQRGCSGITGKIFFGTQGVVVFEAIVTETPRICATLNIIRSTEPTRAQNTNMIFEGIRTGNLLRGTLKTCCRQMLLYEVTLAKEASFAGDTAA